MRKKIGLLVSEFTNILTHTNKNNTSTKLLQPRCEALYIEQETVVLRTVFVVVWQLSMSKFVLSTVLKGWLQYAHSRLGAFVLF